MLRILTVANISQYIHVTNLHIVHIKLIQCYMSIINISIKLEEKRNTTTFVPPTDVSSEKALLVLDSSGELN